MRNYIETCCKLIKVLDPKLVNLYKKMSTRGNACLANNGGDLHQNKRYSVVSGCLMFGERKSKERNGETHLGTGKYFE